ncbi:MAG: energy transducer TonB [Thiobacillaceae bacterium]|nr:energy transducer TonB [Thiobacillaceae bacterium]
MSATAAQAAAGVHTTGLSDAPSDAQVLRSAQPTPPPAEPRAARAAEALTAVGAPAAASAALTHEAAGGAGRVEAHTAVGAQPRTVTLAATDAVSMPPRPARTSAAMAGEAQRAAVAHERDKTPWTAATPVEAPTPALDLRLPPTAAWGEAAGTPAVQSGERLPAEAAGRGLSAVAEPLGLKEAESAPSSALALARLAPSARACFGPPPPEWNAQGRVVLRIRVDEEGRPAEVAIDSGSGDARLDRLAREQALRCARFDLYDRQGRRRPGLVRLPVVYRFTD